MTGQEASGVCPNCGGQKCMDCVLRHVHDECVDDCPTCCDPSIDALYQAWTIIANAHGGDWSQAAPEWRQAAERWRDEVFHRLLAGHDSGEARS